MKKYVHIKSLIACNISINGEFFNQSQLDLITNKDFYVAFFPTTTERYLPCATAFYGNIRPSCITKIPYNNNHYELIYNPAIVPNNENEIIILNKKYNNTIFTIKNSHMSFISITGINFTHNSTSGRLQSTDFKTSDGYAIITGKIKNEKHYLLIYNSKKNKVILEGVFNKLEASKNQIKALKEQNSIAGYGTVYEFNIITKKLSKNSVYLNSLTTNSTSELIPYTFLESLMYSDYKNAKIYLQNSNVSNEHLKSFFGDIEKIYFNGYSKDINYTILTNNTYRNFTFSIDNNKIIEIEENQLNLV